MNKETRSTEEVQVPVLIVGGALIGLSMSLFLAGQGVPSLLVEKHLAPARLPRARGYNARTTELTANSAPLTQHPKTLRGEPGTRAPHLTLERQGSRASTIDLGGGKWSLWLGAQDVGWNEAAQSVAQEMGLSITVHSIGTQAGWKDIEGRFEECYSIDATGASLVRPDGFVAWRSPNSVDYPQRQFKQAFSSILGK